MPKKKRELKLTEVEIKELKKLTNSGECRVRVYKRARILLLSDGGQSDDEIMQQAEVSQSTLHRVRQRFWEEGISSIWDKPKAGRPSIFDGEQRTKITALACSEAPAGYAKWSLRLLADQAVELGYVEEISHETVGVILKKTNLNPI